MLILIVYPNYAYHQKYGARVHANVNVLSFRNVEGDINGILTDGKYIFHYFIIYKILLIYLYSACVPSCPTGYCKHPLVWDP